MISYLPFWRTLKEKNVSTYVLIQKKQISPPTLQRMRNNENVSMRTIDDLCQILDCKITDIVEILPDGSELPSEYQERLRHDANMRGAIAARSISEAQKKKTLIDEEIKNSNNKK